MVMSFLFSPQIVFEVVTSGQRGLLAIKDVVLQGHQCSKICLTITSLHFLSQEFLVFNKLM